MSRAWVLTCRVHFNVCYWHVRYVFQSQCTFCNCLNVRELVARNRRNIWSCDCNYFEQEVPWHSGNYRLWIQFEKGRWYDTVLFFLFLKKSFKRRNKFPAISLRLKILTGKIQWFSATYSIQYKNGSLAASDLFNKFTYQLSSINSTITY